MKVSHQHMYFTEEGQHDNLRRMTYLPKWQNDPVSYLMPAAFCQYFSNSNVPGNYLKINVDGNSEGLGAELRFWVSN